MIPGSTSTDWMPNGASSCASPSPIPSCANLVAQYIVTPEPDHATAHRGDGHDPPAAGCAHVRAATAFVTAIVPSTLVSKQLADLLLRAVLEAAAQADSAVVDEPVDAAGLLRTTV